MKRFLPLALALALAAPLPADEPADYVPLVPEGAVPFAGARYTQSISVLDERDVIAPSLIAAMTDKRWRQPGGLDGISGWKSERYRFLPAGTQVKAWVGNIGVKNSYGYVQQNRGLLRAYPTGTRFDEVLRNSASGKVFEHRVREKWADGWRSTVHFKDETARPDGYTGLTVACSSCHKEAGTGGYAEGLVPGGDTVLGDPLPWSLWRATSPETAPPAAPPTATLNPFVPYGTAPPVYVPVYSRDRAGRLWVQWVPR